MALDLNGLNILGFYREPKRRRANYEHRDQLTFFLEDNPQFRLKYRFKKETIWCLANAFHEEIGPLIVATNHAFTTEQRICNCTEILCYW